MADQPSFFKGWTEPESAANTDYPPDFPYNHVIASASGHTLEMDDSKNRERVRLAHRTGTFIEMHPNGDEVHKVYGNNYVITVQDNKVLIQGTCIVTIDGDSFLHIKGDRVEQVDGNYELNVKGNYTQVIEKTGNITIKNDLKILSGASIGGGAMTLASADGIYVESDFNVDGEIVAGKIFSKGRVDANNGISAGWPGFVTQFGGISVGFPVPGGAIPVAGMINCFGNINSLTSINAFVSMNAPTANFGIMSSVLMTDLINTGIYDVHIHPSPKGMTGPPTMPMV